MARNSPRPHYGTKRRQRKDGYIDLYRPGHPLARRDGYVMEHRFLAWEAGLFDDPTLQVHHINEIRDDNRLENLEILDAAEHTLRHIDERGGVSNQHGKFPLRPHAGKYARKNYMPGCQCPICVRARERARAQKAAQKAAQR